MDTSAWRWATQHKNEHLSTNYEDGHLNKKMNTSARQWHLSMKMNTPAWRWTPQHDRTSSTRELAASFFSLLPKSQNKLSLNCWQAKHSLTLLCVLHGWLSTVQTITIQVTHKQITGFECPAVSHDSLVRVNLTRQELKPSTFRFWLWTHVKPSALQFCLPSKWFFSQGRGWYRQVGGWTDQLAWNKGRPSSRWLMTPWNHGSDSEISRLMDIHKFVNTKT